MFKILVIIALLCTVHGAERAMTSAEIDALIMDVFGDTSLTAKPSPADASPAAESSTASTPIPKPSGDTCTTNYNQEGKCVPYYRCPPDNKDGVYENIDSHVMECESYLDLCCALDNIQPDELSTQTPKKKGCGYINENGVGFLLRINLTNGETFFGEFPWVVAILKLVPIDEKDPKGPTKEVYAGSGTLIHPQVVLTVAHILAARNSPYRQLRVRAGEWDTQTTKEIFPHQDRDVDMVQVHKDYNQGTLFYDIAVLFLSSPLELTPNVGVACLPPAKERADAGTKCIATGWGKERFGREGTYQVILKKVEISVVGHSDCQKQLQKTRLGSQFMLHSSFMCAGGERSLDTCFIDGGAPLICPIQHESGRYMQSGMVAWGVGCDRNSPPGAYVDVANLREWVDDQVAGRGLDPTTYSY